MALSNETVTVDTRPCSICHQPGWVNVDRKGYLAWKAGALIQDALPEMSTELREQLITGTHPECWFELFGDGDPEPDEDKEWAETRDRFKSSLLGEDGATVLGLEDTE